MSETRDIAKRVPRREAKRNILFTIAIDKYEHLKNLRNAVKDVEDFSDVLTRLYQFKKEEVIKLHNEEATANNIRMEFNKLIRSLTPEDNIILYFSGHGYYDNISELGFWIPVEGQENTSSTFVSNNDIAHFLRKIKAHHVLLIVDSCFSGSMLEQFRSAHNPSEEFSSRKIFTSGKNDIVTDGIPGENSPFAGGIINFLRQTTERVISTNTLIEAVKRTLADAVDRGLIKQQQPDDGIITYSNDNGGQFYFYKKLSEEEYWSNVKSKGTQEAYENYLELFPDGYYRDKAHEKVRERKSEKAWKDAVIDNTIPGYKNFIENNSGNTIMIEEAQLRLEELIKGREQIILANKKEAEAREKRESYRDTYKGLFRAAEELFNNDNFKEARKNYYECLLYYQEDSDFIPTKEIVDQRIKTSNDNVLFIEYKEGGLFYYKNRLFDTAIEFLKKAQEIKPDDEMIHDYIEYSQERLANPLPIIQVSVGTRGGNKIFIRPGDRSNGQNSNRIKVTINKSIKSIPRVRVRPKILRPKTTVKINPQPPFSNRILQPVLMVIFPYRGKKTDLTYLWIALTVLIYLLACKISNVF